MQRGMAAGGAHLDTVRALHQTVVSLRTALELSKSELRDLKEKYERHSHCLQYANVIERLTLENHVLRRRILDSECEGKEPSARGDLQVTYSPRALDPASEVVVQSATEVLSVQSPCQPDVGSEKDTSEPGEWQQPGSPGDTLEPWQPSHENSDFCSSEKLNEPEPSETPELHVSAEFSPIDSPEHTEQEEQSQIVSVSKENSDLPNFKTHLELLSKFDVRIKVRTLKEGAASSGTSDSDSTFDERSNRKTNIEKTFEYEGSREQFDNRNHLNGNKINLKSVSTENIKMAVSNEGDGKNKADKFDVQVRITSEESLELKDSSERTSRKHTLNLDVDDLSLRSLSEGDNSVFSGSATPVERPSPAERPLPVQHPSTEERAGEASGNESEEVDDIELIFTTDESKDMTMNLQEDLVSIREGEAWPPPGSAHSTPVLVKFHTLDPELQEPAPAPEAALAKRVSLPSDKEIRRVAFGGREGLDAPARGILRGSDRWDAAPGRGPGSRLDSVDSLTCEYNRGLSFDNTKSSSLELGSSMDVLLRGDSLDGARRAGLPERDLSKCGTSQDELAASLHARRNTCPNPFQYRAPHRGGGVSRAPGPLKAGARARPAARDLPRREHAVQTNVSALPDRWSSDSYLAHKLALPPPAAPPTLPLRAARRAAGRERPGAARRCDETRRVLLSDIGFTSMVPELSRSAEPVWARRHLDEDSLSNNTAKFLARSPPALSSELGDWARYSPHRAHSLYSSGWRSSLPDVRRDDTEELLEEAECFVRRSAGELAAGGAYCAGGGRPYIPAGPRQLRLGHAVKLITPQGRMAVGRVRYVGLAGGGVLVGAEVARAAGPALPPNDGTHAGRRYFLAPPDHTALFVPFSKVVMAWAP